MSGYPMVRAVVSELKRLEIQAPLFQGYSAQYCMVHQPTHHYLLEFGNHLLGISGLRLPSANLNVIDAHCIPTGSGASHTQH